MKTWVEPNFDVADIKRATATTLNGENGTSGSTTQEDLWTCSNPYWEGNGKNPQDVKSELESSYHQSDDQYWKGGWGN